MKPHSSIQVYRNPSGQRMYRVVMRDPHDKKLRHLGSFETLEAAEAQLASFKRWATKKEVKRG